MTAVAQSTFTPNAIEILCKRYFQQGDEFPQCEYFQISSGKTGCGNKHETVDQLIERISMGVPEYREIIERGEFLPNSPTIFNMGTKAGGTLSACFKFDIEDTMFDSENGIMPVAMKAAKTLKSGGGVGYVFSQLRPEGAAVSSTHGKALGPLGVMRIYHRLAKEITQGGKRDAAQMGIMHVSHPDIHKFIHVKDENPDDLGTFNISVNLPDDFMQRAVDNHDGPEYAFLKEMSESAWKTGDPGCFFGDAAERFNPTPWLGKLTGTNPCGEVPLLNNEPCNLGSINLGKFFRVDGLIDVNRLSEVACIVTRYLDDVLDRNVFPDPAIDLAARTTRKLGGGVCGFADLLALLHIHYDTDEAVTLGRNLMGIIDGAALRESQRLAEVKGVAPCFEGTNIKLRNATRTCIAPTGTIAILMNASSGIEPHFSLENTRTMGDGTTFVERPWVLDETDFVPKTAHEIDWEWHVKHQAAFQEHVNLAVSKTINMPESATPDDILAAYISMWQLGCKGGTIYRNGSRSNQVLKAIDDVGLFVVGPEKVTVKEVNGWRDPIADEAPSIRHKFEVGGMEGYLHVGLYPDGQPAEIFLDVARQGSTISGMADWLGQTASVAFQMAHKHGVPFNKITEKWVGRRFEPSGFTSNQGLPMAVSLADYIARYLHARFGVEAPVQSDNSSGEACPDCGAMLIFEDGCAHCRSCGYERC